MRGQRPDQRVADEVGEADLAAAAAGEVVVDHDAVVGQQLRRHRAHAGRGRHLQRGVHVLHDLGGDAAQRGGLRAGRGVPAPSAARLGRRGRLGRRRLARRAAGGAAGAAGAAGGARSRRRACRRGAARGGRARPAPSSASRSRRRPSAGLVVGEEVVPGRVDAGRVGEVPLVHLLGGRLAGRRRGGWRRRGGLPASAFGRLAARSAAVWPARVAVGAGVAGARARVGSRRRSRARPSRRSWGRRGSAGTSPRRSTRSGRNPPVGCPAKSAGSTRPVIASFTRVRVSRGVRRRPITGATGDGSQATPYECRRHFRLRLVVRFTEDARSSVKRCVSRRLLVSARTAPAGDRSRHRAGPASGGRVRRCPAAA